MSFSPATSFSKVATCALSLAGSSVRAGDWAAAGLVSAFFASADCGFGSVFFWSLASAFFWSLASAFFWSLASAFFWSLASAFFWSLASAFFSSLASDFFWSLASDFFWSLASAFWSLASAFFWSLASAFGLSWALAGWGANAIASSPAVSSRASVSRVVRKRSRS